MLVFSAIFICLFTLVFVRPLRSSGQVIKLLFINSPCLRLTYSVSLLGLKLVHNKNFKFWASSKTPPSGGEKSTPLLDIIDKNLFREVHEQRSTIELHLSSAHRPSYLTKIKS